LLPIPFVPVPYYSPYSFYFIDADAKEKFTFTLTSNEDKVLPLQAMNQQDLDEWLLVLKNSIALRVRNEERGSSSSILSYDFCLSSFFLSSVEAQSQQSYSLDYRRCDIGRRRRAQEAVRKNGKTISSALIALSFRYNTMRSLSQANCFCADCGKRDPDWAAYNLGVIICFECR
jgi:hypothetical protein